MLRAQEAPANTRKIGTRGVTALALALAVALLANPSPVLAGEDHIEPLGSAWKNVIVPKFRGIVSFMDTDYGIKTYRGQGESLDTDLSKYYGTNVITTTPSHLGLSGSGSSRVFSQTQAAGVVPQTVTIADDFLGTKAYNNVPTGIFCTSYLTKLNDDGSSTALWMELTGRIEGTNTMTTDRPPPSGWSSPGGLKGQTPSGASAG